MLWLTRQQRQYADDVFRKILPVVKARTGRTGRGLDAQYLRDPRDYSTLLIVWTGSDGVTRGIRLTVQLGWLTVRIFACKDDPHDTRRRLWWVMSSYIAAMFIPAGNNLDALNLDWLDSTVGLGISAVSTVKESDLGGVYDPDRNWRRVRPLFVGLLLLTAIGIMHAAYILNALLAGVVLILLLLAVITVITAWSTSSDRWYD